MFKIISSVYLDVLEKKINDLSKEGFDVVNIFFANQEYVAFLKSNIEKSRKNKKTKKEKEEE